MTAKTSQDEPTTDGNPTLNERIAAIGTSIMRTYHHSLQRRGLRLIDDNQTITSLAELALRAQGFVHLPRVIVDSSLISDLDEHISRVEADNARQTAAGLAMHEHASGSLLPPALEPEGRSDVLLLLQPPVTSALSAALIGSGLQTLLTACLGPDALMWELSAMRSRPGARPQPFHPDVNWQSDEPSALVVWIALCDVTREMGPTLLIPRTHTQRAHAIFRRADAATAAAAVGCERLEAPLLRRGDALIMDSRVLHCGQANLSASERTLFYCTFRRAGNADAEWLQSSLRESLRDRYPLEDLCRELSQCVRSRARV